MGGKSIIDSFNYAVSGIIIAIKTEKNMLIHYLIAIIIIILSLFFDFSRTEFLLLLFAISLVLIAEMFNTAIERVVDLVTEEYHPLAALVKDVAAGAVLIAAINSIIVGYLLFFERLSDLTELVILKIQRSSIHLTFVALILVVLVTIGLKAMLYKGKGTHFQGGVVSGHAALSFCAATTIAALTQNMLIITLSYGLAILVGESRIEGKIHTFIEVVFGAIIGILIGVLVFKIRGLGG